MSDTIAYLERFIAAQPDNSIFRECACAKLSAMVGDIATASATLDNLLRSHGDHLGTDEFIFRYLLHIALLTLRLDTAADILNRRFGTDRWFNVRYEDRSPAWLTVVGLRISGTSSATFVFGTGVRTSDRLDFIVNRWINVLPLFAEFHQHEAVDAGEIQVNMEDHGVVPGLAFSESRPEYVLIPDPPYLASRGYADIRDHYRKHDVEWQQRRPLAFWRGATTGKIMDRTRGWRSLPRIKLCEIGRGHSELIDAGISNVAQMPKEIEDEIMASELILPFVPAKDFNQYKYQIDIDGNTNSWPGLFQKLLTGSPVLKVASQEGFRQWYYDRLKPWVNFIPIDSDMSDLVDKVTWLTTHDDTAREIGANGRALAESLEYSVELKRASPVIRAAVDHFSGRRVSVMKFQRTRPELDAATTSAEIGADVVEVEGLESRFEMARPVVADDFVLTLEVSPAVAGTQRLSIIANGEVLRQASIAKRTELDCFVSRRVVERSDRLVLTVYHPDVVPAASAERPLDTRMLSVAFHQLRITPAGLHRGAAVGTLPADSAPARATRQGAVMKAMYGRDIWHGFVPTRPRASEVQGWNGRHPVFARLLDRIANKTVIDVAAWQGQASIFVADLMRQDGIDGCVVAVDTFLAEEHWQADGRLFTRYPGGRPDVCETFLENVSYAGLADLVVPLFASTGAAARLLTERGITAGLIHLDSSRDYVELLRDAEAYWQLLEPGGYLVGDDYSESWPEVIKAAHEFAARVERKLEIALPKWIISKN